MRRCLNCNTSFNCLKTSLACPTCGIAPENIDNFLAYAPQLSRTGGGFKNSYFSDLEKLEAANFWFRYRNQLILWTLKKYCGSFNSFLEIGCGTGYVLSAVAKAFPNAMTYGSEIFIEGLKHAATRLTTANLMQMDARNIPFSEEFEVIGAFDVLEHIHEDELVLSQIYSALKPEGYLILTVPQHPWLWSAMDEYAFHVRRYNARDLQQKIEASGFKVLRTTSFVTTLLPAMILSRFSKKKTSYNQIDVTTEFKISPLINNLFLNILQFELKCIKKGWNLPLGGSRLVIARKAE
jgi:SAM-dependent methyltransferase